MRLDKYLVDNNYFNTRTKASNEIKEGHVLIDGIVIYKPNFDYKEGNITLNNTLKYVSRGGLKLEGAIESFHLDFTDKIVLDIGASTGGFTDCAIQHGAKKVYSVDVGSDQLDIKLRNNPNVISMENTNILDTNISDNIDILVMDVSFVSIKHLIPSILRYLNDNNFLVCLIKPQFEVGKIINKGIVKDKKIHLQVLKNVKNYLEENNMFINKLAPSPIKGGSGNIEYLALISKTNKGYVDLMEIVDLSHRKE